jgi:hypothetical protein
MFETRVADLLQHAAGEYIHVRSSFPFFLGAFALSFAHFSLSLSLSSSVRVLYIYILLFSTIERVVEHRAPRCSFFRNAALFPLRSFSFIHIVFILLFAVMKLLGD